MFIIIVTQVKRRRLGRHCWEITSFRRDSFLVAPYIEQARACGADRLRLLVWRLCRAITSCSVLTASARAGTSLVLRPTAAVDHVVVSSSLTSGHLLLTSPTHIAGCDVTKLLVRHYNHFFSIQLNLTGPISGNKGKAALKSLKIPPPPTFK